MLEKADIQCYLILRKDSCCQRKEEQLPAEAVLVAEMLVLELEDCKRTMQGQAYETENSFHFSTQFLCMKSI